MAFTSTTLIIVSMLAGNSVSPLTMMLSFPEHQMCVTVLEETMQMQLRVAQSNLTGAQQPVLERTGNGSLLRTPARLMSEGKCVTSRVVN